MSRFTPAHVAVLLFFAAATTSCAAEHLEARDRSRGASAPDGATTSVARPTDLRATEKQLGPGAASSSDASAPIPHTEITTHEHGSENTIYQCPMHPEVQSNAPGTCPKCGMTLQKTRSP